MRADRGSSTRRFPRPPRTRRSPGFPTVVDGNAVLRLKPWEERTTQAAADRRRAAAASSRRFPGAIAFPLNPPSLGQSFRSTPVEFVVMSQVPYAELQRIVDRFLDEVRKYPGVQNLQTDLRLNTPEVRVDDQPRQARRRRRRRRHGGPHAGDDAGRPPGHALQAATASSTT